MSPIDGIRAGKDAARLAAIRQHLESFLPSATVQHFWEEGFTQLRQPSFRFNTLRTQDLPASGSHSATPLPSIPDFLCNPNAAVHQAQYHQQHQQHEQALTQQMFLGFGLPPETPLEVCPYFPRARLLPPTAAAAVHVASRAQSLAPLQSGAVYFMGLSSMLPALALMAPLPQPRGARGQLQQEARSAVTQAAAVAAAAGAMPRDERVAAPGDIGAATAATAGGGDVSRDKCQSPGRGSGSQLGTGLRVLDLCAAPGGKAALLAELMGNRGTLLAVDASWPRLQRLQYNLKRLIPDHHPHNHNHHRYHSHDGHDNDSDYNSHQQGYVAVQNPAAHERRHVQAQATSNDVVDNETLTPLATDAPPRWMWRVGCVTALHADGTTLEVNEHGLPLLSSAPSSTPLRPPIPRSPAGRRERHSHPSPPPPSPVTSSSEAAAGAVGVYDRILVDAPCSGLGRLQLGRPASYADWDERWVGRHAARQRALLMRAVRLLRRGGSLVYSTCTINPQENEAVLAWLLTQVEGLTLVPPRIVLPPPQLAPHTHPADATFSAAYYHGHVPFPSSSPAAAAADGNGSHGCGIADSSTGGGGPVPHVVLLRDALEAHRPGCTYPPLLDGPWWSAAATSGAAAAAAAASAAGSATIPGTSGGGGVVARNGQLVHYLGGQPPRRRPQRSPMLDLGALRDQLAAGCVRVAPGPTYEGFFLAQIVKET